MNAAYASCTVVEGHILCRRGTHCFAVDGPPDFSQDRGARGDLVLHLPSLSLTVPKMHRHAQATRHAPLRTRPQAMTATRTRAPRTPHPHQKRPPHPLPVHPRPPHPQQKSPPHPLQPGPHPLKPARTWAEDELPRPVRRRAALSLKCSIPISAPAPLPRGGGIVKRVDKPRKESTSRRRPPGVRAGRT